MTQFLPRKNMFHVTSFLLPHFPYTLPPLLPHLLPLSTGLGDISEVKIFWILSECISSLCVCMFAGWCVYACVCHTHAQTNTHTCTHRRAPTWMRMCLLCCVAAPQVFAGCPGGPYGPVLFAMASERCQETSAPSFLPHPPPSFPLLPSAVTVGVKG